MFNFIKVVCVKFLNLLISNFNYINFLKSSIVKLDGIPNWVILAINSWRDIFAISATFSSEISFSTYFYSHRGYIDSQGQNRARETKQNNFLSHIILPAHLSCPTRLRIHWW